MGLFDRFKKKEKNNGKVINWQLEIDGTVTIENPGMKDIEKWLNELSRFNIEFFILSPLQPIKKCNFMQVTDDHHSDFFHLEFSILKEKGYTLYGKDGLTYEETYDIFNHFMLNQQLPDITDWDIIFDK